MTDETDNFSEETEDVADDNLGIRQRALNTRVNEAAANQVQFDDVKNTIETSDLDRLFKIDLAAKYKQTDYIIQTLKSADSLYITRAINKSLWLYDAEHINIINPDYLHHTIFPFMSIKMMKKFLTAISNHVRDEERATEFFNYCMKNKLNAIGFKFLLFTKEEFRRDLLLDHKHEYFKDLTKKDVGYIKKYIRKSYVLLETYLNTLPIEKRYDFVFDLQYMYLVNNDKYIDLLEKYEPNDHDITDERDLQSYWKKFNLKLSKNIMTKHKKRVLENPRFFVRRIDNTAFDKYITIDDAKKLAIAYLPATAAEFWDMFYSSRLKFFLKLIPHEETYVFLKKLFNDRYPNEEFEMSSEFSIQEYQLFMTKAEREEWALRRLKYDSEPYYGFYEYINFETSFEAVKKMIMVTKHEYDRNNMCMTLLKSARGHRDLETLFNYYSEIHSNESRMIKDNFLRLVISETNVFEYDDGCWNAFYNLLLGMELYDIDLSSHNNKYKTVTLIYHILNKKDINKELLEFLSDNFSYHMIDTSTFGYFNQFTDEKRNSIYNYLFDCYIARILECKDQIFTSKVSSRLKRYSDNITGLMRIFREEKIEDEIDNTQSMPICYSQKYKKTRDASRALRFDSLSDKELLRRLKKDTNLVVADDFLAKIRVRFSKYPVNITNFLKKLKIYFAHDVAQTYLNFFADLVDKKINMKSIETSVFAVLLLGDVKSKTAMLEKYAPQEQSKVETPEDKSVETYELSDADVREAIRRFVCYSRPTMPMSYIQKYLTKDQKMVYRQLLVMCLENLPIHQCLQLEEITKTQTGTSEFPFSEFRNCQRNH